MYDMISRKAQAMGKARAAKAIKVDADGVPTDEEMAAVVADVNAAAERVNALALSEFVPAVRRWNEMLAMGGTYQAPSSLAADMADTYYDLIA